MTAVVVGQVAQDLVLRVPSVPGEGGTAPVEERRELLGGKGANQGVALRQLTRGSDLDVALVGVVGDDAAGRGVLVQAAGDGLDVRHVRVRPGARTALLVDVTDGRGDRRVLEHVPREVLLTEDDVLAAAPVLRPARLLLLQLQQPAAALLRAVRLAEHAGVVLDGVPESRQDELLRAARVLRADAAEAELLVGRSLATPDEALAAADELRACGPEVVALGVHGFGDVLTWAGGASVLPHLDVAVADPTGGGDSFLAGLVTALGRGLAPQQAGEAARAAAAATVSRTGGRPGLLPVVPQGPDTPSAPPRDRR